MANEIDTTAGKSPGGFVPVSNQLRQEAAEKYWREHWPVFAEKQAKNQIVSNDFGGLIFPLLEAALAGGNIQRTGQVIAAVGEVTPPESDMVEWLKLTGKAAAQAGDIDRVSGHARQLFSLVASAATESMRIAAWAAAGVLADALDDLDHFDASALLHRQSVSAATDLFGPGHRNVLDSQNDLANALHTLGRHAEAEDVLRAVLIACEHAYGPHHPGTLRSRDNLALALHLQGKHAEAEQEFRKVLASRLRVLGPAHFDTLSSRNNLALELSAQGKYAEEEQEHRAVLATQERLLGPENPRTLWTRSLLIFTQRIQNKHALAEAGLRELLKIRERVLGPSHADTLKTRTDLAATLRVQGKYRDAVNVQRELLAIREHVHGLEHPEVYRSCFNLAFALLYTGDLKEAAKFAGRNEQGCLKHYGPDHLQTREARKLRENIQAEASQRDWLDEFRKGWHKSSIKPLVAS